ncbi:MAG: hypothetical protein OEV49_00560 [candidate division Zixibacteria bacterium]|nr:hypothetical protein [candidate division Zixibacteria bacterium]MDH3937018.1 hypothetical protein [candidate division Zixibacteria bacterium]MDH4032164.1 hypothetical protein [candidate division Zixibacteria bacterium]
MLNRVLGSNRISTLAVICLSLANSCLAGGAAWDDPIMATPQTPDDSGWCINGTHPFILTDDWTSQVNGNLKGLQFWGSWMNGTAGQIDSFHLRMFSNNPGSLHDWPSALLWETVIPIANVAVLTIDPTAIHGWHQPYQESYTDDDYSQYFQYIVQLAQEQWFEVGCGVEYWLSVSAYVSGDGDPQWGWLSTALQAGDASMAAENTPFNWLRLAVPPAVYDYIPGNADGSGWVDMSDLVYLSDFLSTGGPPPPYTVPGVDPPFYAGADANSDCEVDGADLEFIQLMFDGGGYTMGCYLYPSRFFGDSLDLSFVVTGESQVCCKGAGRGDFACDGDDVIDISDLVAFVDWMFNSGPGPCCVEEWNINGSYGCMVDCEAECDIDIADLVYLVDWMFNSGPAPAPCP